MQTPSISPVANSLPSQTQNAGAAQANEGGPAFNQLLSQEVAQRKSAEAPRAQEGKKDKSGAKEAQATNEGAKSDGEAKPAEAAQAPQETGSEEAEAAADAATHASAELLALVANIAQLQNGEGAAKDGAAGTEEAQAETGLEGGRKRSSPFAAIHAAIGARANHGTQSKPEATWAAQAERGTSTRIEPGKSDSALPLQAASSAQALAGGKNAASPTEFATSLKDANQLLQPLQQQAVAQTAQQLAPQTADKLSPRLGTPAWDQALGQKIVWMVNGEQQSASLTLNPPELGPLKVVLQVSNTQANATFVAAQPEVRQALEAAMPRLRDMLGDAGIQLGQATVDSGAQQQQTAERQMERRSGTAGGVDTAESGTQAAATRVQPTAAGKGLVDTFA